MNVEEPLMPVKPSDTPMDEFEYTGKGKGLLPKNSLKMIKTGGIILGILVILGIAAVVAVNLLNKKGNQVANATPTPEPSVTFSPKPQVAYPQEYIDLQNDIDSYDKTVNSVSDDRTRIEVPQIKFDISF